MGTFHWNEAVGGTADICRATGVTPRTLRHWRDTGRARKRSPAGPSSQFTAAEIAALLFQAALTGLGVSAPDAAELWRDAGVDLLDRRMRSQPDLTRSPVTLVFFRQTDGRMAAVPVGDDDTVRDPVLFARMKSEERAGRPAVFIDVDALFNEIQRRITRHCPDCPAVRGPTTAN